MPFKATPASTLSRFCLKNLRSCMDRFYGASGGGLATGALAASSRARP